MLQPQQKLLVGRLAVLTPMARLSSSLGILSESSGYGYSCFTKSPALIATYPIPCSPKPPVTRRRGKCVHACHDIEDI